MKVKYVYFTGSHYIVQIIVFFASVKTSSLTLWKLHNFIIVIIKIKCGEEFLKLMYYNSVRAKFAS